MSRRMWGRYSINKSVEMQLRKQRLEYERQQKEQARRAREAEIARKLKEGMNTTVEKIKLWEKVKEELIIKDILRYVETDKCEDKYDELKSQIGLCRTKKELDEIKKKVTLFEKELKELARVGELKKRIDQIENEKTRNNQEKTLGLISVVEDQIESLAKEQYSIVASDEILILRKRAVDTRIICLNNDVERVSAELASINSEIVKTREYSFKIWNEYIECSQGAIDKVEELYFDIVTLMSNKIVIGWCKPDVKKAKDIIDSYKAKIIKIVNSNNSFQKRMEEIKMITNEFNNIKVNIDLIQKQAYSKEDEELNRAYIVESILDTLSNMGFVMNKGPQLLQDNDPSSTVLISANLPSGKYVDVKINSNGAIYTDFNGYIADECIKDIGVFKNILDNKFLINYDARGEQKNNPDKISKSVRDIPSGNLGKKDSY